MDNFKTIGSFVVKFLLCKNRFQELSKDILFVKNYHTMKDLHHFQVMNEKHIFHKFNLLRCAWFSNHNLRFTWTFGVKLIPLEIRLMEISNDIWFVKNNFKMKKLCFHKVIIEMLSLIL